MLNLHGFSFILLSFVRVACRPGATPWSDATPTLRALERARPDPG
jgi:hypothetical protein